MTTLSKSLFELANVMKQIEENDGEITNEILPILSKNETTVLEKVDSYVFFYDNVKAQIEGTKKTIEKFKKTLQTLENLESRLKDNVKHLMNSYDLVKIEGHERSIKMLKSGGVTPIHKPEDLYIKEETINPKYVLELDNYIEEKIVYVIKDKDEFKKAIHENKIHSCYELPRGNYVKFT